MATLNIKQFPDDLYGALRARANTDRRSIAQVVIVLLGEALDFEPQCSVMELKGLGARHLRNHPARECVAASRDAWT